MSLCLGGIICILLLLLQSLLALPLTVAGTIVAALAFTALDTVKRVQKNCFLSC